MGMMMDGIGNSYLPHSSVAAAIVISRADSGEWVAQLQSGLEKVSKRRMRPIQRDEEGDSSGNG